MPQDPNSVESIHEWTNSRWDPELVAPSPRSQMSSDLSETIHEMVPPSCRSATRAIQRSTRLPTSDTVHEGRPQETCTAGYQCFLSAHNIQGSFQT